MSQDQPRRPADQGDDGTAIKYGDVFPVGGDLAEQAIAPRDAAMMQSAENTVLGQTPKGGAAAVMESAATRNEQRGMVGHYQSSSIAADQGMTVTETDIPGQPRRSLVTEFVGGQAVGQYVVTTVTGGDGNQGGGDERRGAGGGGGGGQARGGHQGGGGKITIGDALQAAALTAGDKPVEQSDAAAIQAAEAAAVGINVPGGLAATAQSAAAANARIAREEDKTKLRDVLGDASLMLPDDKEATREDAERVMRAEMHNNPNLGHHPGGVATSVVAAAQLNQAR